MRTFPFWRHGIEAFHLWKIFRFALVSNPFVSSLRGFRLANNISRPIGTGRQPYFFHFLTKIIPRAEGFFTFTNAAPGILQKPAFQPHFASPLTSDDRALPSNCSFKVSPPHHQHIGSKHHCKAFVVGFPRP